MNWVLLGQTVRLEDVFKSAQDHMQQAPGSGRILALVLCTVGLIALLTVLQLLRSQWSNPATVNHQGKLLKEVLKELPLKSRELKGLKDLATRQSCESPLTLLLCPSLLTRSMREMTPEQRKTLNAVMKRLASERVEPESK